ncbi:MAG: glycosyltransferase family 2 protein [Acidimicrobiales bacterium]
MAASSAEEAIWTSNIASFEAVREVTIPFYLGPPVRPHLPTAVARSVLRPFLTGSSLASHLSPRDILSFNIWQDTARIFGIRKVLNPDGSPSLLTHSLPKSQAPRTAAPPSVGLAMMVQDEEKRLARCLESVAGWVAEIVIVDGGSRDSTIDIARSFGAHVIERRFDGNYGAQRNEGLKIVRTPWVLMLDADEVLSEDLPPMLDQVASCGNVDGAYIHLLNKLGDDTQPWFWPDRKMRFFKSGRLYAGRIHEKVQGIKRAAYLPMSGPFIHHHKSMAEQWDREKQYLEMDPTYYSDEDAKRIRQWRSGTGDAPA